MCVYANRIRIRTVNAYASALKASVPTSPIRRRVYILSIKIQMRVYILFQKCTTLLCAADTWPPTALSAAPHARDHRQ